MSSIPSLLGENPPGIITSTNGILNRVDFLEESVGDVITVGSVEFNFTFPKLVGAVTTAVLAKIPDKLLSTCIVKIIESSFLTSKAD